ncbi:MAG: HD-GYP domain-containing protein [bacterium]
MSGLPARAQIFLWLVVAAAVGITALSAVEAIATSPGLTAALGLTALPDILTSLAAVVGIVIAGLYPICLGNKIRTSVGTALIFATAVLMGPLRAGLLVAVSVAIYTTIKRREERWPLYYPIFNVAQLALVAMVTSQLFMRLNPSGDVTLTSWPSAVAVIGGVLCYFGLNNLIVATMSAIVQNRAIAEVWRAMFQRWQTYATNFGLLLLGIFIAAIYYYSPLLVPLAVVPLLLVHQAIDKEQKIQNQTRETLEVLADTIDKRDAYTFEHSQRVAEYAVLTARRLGLAGEEQTAIRLAARVHDVGKIGVREALLNRPGALSAEELEEIRRHTVIGAEIVAKLQEYPRSKEAILYHHERWDGSGIYRLAYDHIPIGARIIAVADAFDAMTSDRPYRRALSRDAAFAELQESKGSQFDPVVVEAFTDAMRTIELAAPPAVPAAGDLGVAAQLRPAQTRH